MPTSAQRQAERPIAPPKPEPITVESFLMLLDGELKVARGLDHSSILYEGRRDDAVRRIAHYFERAKRSPMTPLRRAIGLSTNQMVLPRLEETSARIVASVEGGTIPNLTALEWLTNKTAPAPDETDEHQSAPAGDPLPVSPESDSADEQAPTAAPDEQPNT